MQQRQQVPLFVWEEGPAGSGLLPPPGAGSAPPLLPGAGQAEPATRPLPTAPVLRQWPLPLRLGSDLTRKQGAGVRVQGLPLGEPDPAAGLSLWGLLVHQLSDSHGLPSLLSPPTRGGGRVSSPDMEGAAPFPGCLGDTQFSFRIRQCGGRRSPRPTDDRHYDSEAPVSLQVRGCLSGLRPPGSPPGCLGLRAGGRWPARPPRSSPSAHASGSVWLVCSGLAAPHVCTGAPF